MALFKSFRIQLNTEMRADLEAFFFLKLWKGEFVQKYTYTLVCQFQIASALCLERLYCLAQLGIIAHLLVLGWSGVMCHPCGSSNYILFSDSHKNITVRFIYLHASSPLAANYKPLWWDTGWIILAANGGNHKTPEWKKIPPQPLISKLLHGRDKIFIVNLQLLWKIDVIMEMLTDH